MSNFDWNNEPLTFDNTTGTQVEYKPIVYDKPLPDLKQTTKLIYTKLYIAFEDLTNPAPNNTILWRYGSTRSGKAFNNEKVFVADYAVNKGAGIPLTKFEGDKNSALNLYLQYYDFSQINASEKPAIQLIFPIGSSITNFKYMFTDYELIAL